MKKLIEIAQNYDVRMGASAACLLLGVAGLFSDHVLYTVLGGFALPVVLAFTSQLVGAYLAGRRWFFDDEPERLLYLGCWLLWLGLCFDLKQMLAV